MSKYKFLIDFCWACPASVPQSRLFWSLLFCFSVFSDVTACLFEILLWTWIMSIGMLIYTHKRYMWQMIMTVPGELIWLKYTQTSERQTSMNHACLDLQLLSRFIRIVITKNKNKKTGLYWFVVLCHNCGPKWHKICS